jgi:hypothetical protein
MNVFFQVIDGYNQRYYFLFSFVLLSAPVFLAIGFPTGIYLQNLFMPPSSKD